MLTFPPQRRQGDGLNDEASAATATYVDTTDVLVRPEMAKDLDINRMLTTFGVPMARTEPKQYQVIDYDVDLQTALGAVAEARRAHALLPAELRGKYPTWEKLLEAIEAGTYETPEQEKARIKIERDQARAARQKEFDEFLEAKKDPSLKEDESIDT